MNLDSYPQILPNLSTEFYCATFDYIYDNLIDNSSMAEHFPMMLMGGEL
jgi:hypothetical protein